MSAGLESWSLAILVEWRWRMGDRLKGDHVLIEVHPSRVTNRRNHR